MIAAALLDKLRARGPIGFATDAAELAAACTVVAAWSALCAAGALAVVVVAAPCAAWELLTRAPAGTCRCVNSFDECRCGRGAP